MSIAALGLLLAGASLGLHVDRVGELPEPEEKRLILELSRALEAHSGRVPVLDQRTGSCLEAKCVAEIRSRTESLELALVTVIAGALQLHVVLERVAPDADAASQRAELDLPRMQADLQTPLRALVARVFPARVVEPLVLEPSSPPPEPERSLLAPVLVLSGGAAAAALGVFFGVSSQDSADRLGQPVEPQDVRGLTARAGREALAANLLFVAAGGALAAGAALLVAP